MLAAVWYGQGKENFRVEPIDKPTVGDNDILVHVKSCYWGATFLRAIIKGHAEFKPPLVMGRMLAGDIVEVGNKITDFKIGMRVTVNPEMPCGKCYYCLINEPVHCMDLTILRPGGFAEYARVSEGLVPGVLQIPENLSYDEAAYSETLACEMYGIERANIKFGDTVAIIGSGNVGLSHLQLAKLKGASQILVLDFLEDRLKIAKDLGATHVVNPKNEDAKEAVLKITNGHGADVVMEAVGTAPTYGLTFDLVRKGGTIVAFGGCPPGSEITMDPNWVHYRSLKFIGSYHYYPDLFTKALMLIANGQFNVKPLITHHVSLKEIWSAVEGYGKPGNIMTIIHP